jgi:serine/threonine protein phosphatase PrpC
MKKPQEWSEGWGGTAPHLLEDFAHRVDCHGASIIGSKRTVNQDDYLIVPLIAPADSRRCCEERTAMRTGPPLLLMVADGVGGAPAGERASSIAIRAVHRALTDRSGGFLLHEADGVDPGELLKAVVSRGQKAIEAEIERNTEQSGMGTTLTAALILWPKAHVFHVGDSRCYVVRRSSMEQVTIDHTVAQMLSDSGLHDPDAHKPSRWRNVLWNVIGGRTSEVRPQVSTVDLRWGDALLLATDGLTDSLSQEDILHRVHEEQTAEAVCASLIQTARVRKGKDDMTVIYAQFGRSSIWRQLREIFLGG